MRRWFTLLSLPALALVSCQGAVTPESVGTVLGPDARCSAKSAFSTAWVRRGVGFRRGFRGGWGYRGGFYGGFGFRPVVAAPVIAPVVAAPVVTTVAAPVVSTVVYPTFAGAYGYFW
jgi:hypothetical protein